MPWTLRAIRHLSDSASLLRHPPSHLQLLSCTMVLAPMPTGFCPHTSSPSGACHQPILISGPRSSSFSTRLSSTCAALTPAIFSHRPCSARPPTPKSLPGEAHTPISLPILPIVQPMTRGLHWPWSPNPPPCVRHQAAAPSCTQLPLADAQLQFFSPAWLSQGWS